MFKVKYKKVYLKVLWKCQKYSIKLEQEILQTNSVFLIIIMISKKAINKYLRNTKMQRSVWTRQKIKSKLQLLYGTNKKMKVYLSKFYRKANKIKTFKNKNNKMIAKC